MTSRRSSGILGTLFAAAVFYSLGIGTCMIYPELPGRLKELAKKLNLYPPELPDDKNRDDLPPPPPPPPSVKELNAVLSGSQALVEAQHTYYVHITRNGRFATTIRELGYQKDDGAVMVSEVWQASDAVPQPKPVHGYLFKVLPVALPDGKKPGFAVVAYPAKQRHWPLFLSIIPDAKGGLISMSANDTWEIADPAASAEVIALFPRTDLALADLAKFAPEQSAKTLVVKSFVKELPPSAEPAPEKPEPAPAKPKSEPEKPKSEPEKPKSEPEKPKSEPEKPKSEPEKPNTEPEKL